MLYAARSEEKRKEEGILRRISPDGIRGNCSYAEMQKLILNNSFNKVIYKMQRRAYSRGFQFQGAAFDITAAAFKRIPFAYQRSQFADKILHIGSDVAAEHNITVKTHTQIVDEQGQIVQIPAEFPAANLIAGLYPPEKFRKISAGDTRKPSGVAINIRASLFAAITRLAAVFQRNMPEFAAALVVPTVQALGVHDRAADTVAQRNIHNFLNGFPGTDFRHSACVGVVEQQHGERNNGGQFFIDIVRGGKNLQISDVLAVSGNNCRKRNAGAKDF